MKPIDHLQKFPLLATDSVEEAEFRLSQSLTTCRIKSVADRSQFRVRLNGVGLGRATLVYNRYGSQSRVETELPGEPVFFSVATGKPSCFHFGSGREIATGDRPVLVSQANHMEIERPGNSGMLVLRVSLPELERQLESLTQQHFHGRLRFDQEADLRCDAGGTLVNLTRFLTAELDRDPSLAGNPIFRKSYEDLLLNSLLSLPSNRSVSLLEERRHEVSPGLVHRAEEFMRANLTEAVTVADLLRICQCSRSTLFSAFRNARGYSPMEFLSEQRLECAHERLKHPSESCSVSSIALDCGFTHIGRFAAAYRRRFGKPPSETFRGFRNS